MGKAKTVLCIEDDIETAGLVRLLLDEPEVKTVSALTGRQGLDMVRRLRPDLILLDVYMRDVDGWEIYKRIRSDERLKDTPVIILSGYPKAVISALGKDFRGAADFVRKPFSPVQLRTAVDRALGLVYG